MGRRDIKGCTECHAVHSQHVGMESEFNPVVGADVAVLTIYDSSVRLTHSAVEKLHRLTAVFLAGGRSDDRNTNDSPTESGA